MVVNSESHDAPWRTRLLTSDGLGNSSAPQMLARNTDMDNASDFEERVVEAYAGVRSFGLLKSDHFYENRSPTVI